MYEAVGVKHGSTDVIFNVRVVVRCLSYYPQFVSSAKIHTNINSRVYGAAQKCFRLISGRGGDGPIL